MRAPMRALLALAVLAALLAGCAAGGGLSNQPDHFSYGGAATGKTTTEVYEWANSGTAAQVSWGGGGSGSLSLTMKDAAGATMFARTLGNGGLHERTLDGQPGTWRIELRFQGYNGGMGLNIDKA